MMSWLIKSINNALTERPVRLQFRFAVLHYGRNKIVKKEYDKMMSMAKVIPSKMSIKRGTYRYHNMPPESIH